MIQIVPELYVHGCAQALAYYQQIFGGEIRNVKKADGLKGFEGLEGKIIHAELHLGEGLDLYLVDILDDKVVAGVNVVLHMESEEELNRVYNDLKEGSEIKFPLQKAFWGAHHAVVTDRFHITWALSYLQGH